MLNKKDAIRVERQPRKSGGPRVVYIFKCKNSKCDNLLKARYGELKTRKGTCISCSQKKRPFESIYNGLYNDHRKIKITLTYDEFLLFTQIKNCYYCNSCISWNPYGTIDNKFISRAYCLDRMDNSGPYSKENCVVCCHRCNWLKKDMHHNDFIVLCNAISENFKARLQKLVDKIY